AIVGFDVRALPVWPRGVERVKISLMGEQPDATVMIDYQDANGYTQLTLLASRDPNFEKIGATAAVESVLVGGVPGEYVEGAWVGNGATSRWDPAFPVSSLSWQLETGHYRLRSSAFTKEQLVELGASLR
ncbi:MAG TPA: hypothetical protein VGE07_15215, partial [Herpetosiphonaceae bacterium]